MRKDELILQDYVERYVDKIDDKYRRLYTEQSPELQVIFTYFHQQLNELFDFLNTKNLVNKHYNALASRDLITLIEEFEEFQYVLKSVGEEIVLSKPYQQAIDKCKKFLSPSGGSTIPDDFSPISIVKYEPILESANKSIHISSRRQTFQLSMVGQGAFSIVQKYKDPFYQRTFAVKQALKNLSPREMDRFKKEFEILQKLDFPYILEVYEYDNQNNNYIMEYCDSTLESYINKNNSKLKFYTRKRLALQFLYGLNYIHAKKILHRDISYRNILVKQYEYGAAVIKLSDFGLMKAQESDFTLSDSDIKGTIIDPTLEKFKDYGVVNEIYPVGFILNFIFTGKRHLTSEDSNINRIVQRCIDRDVGKRYSRIIDIIARIENLTEA